MDLLNDEQKKIFDLIDMGYNLFITGGAGVGKSFVINLIPKYFKSKKLGICSMTGSSAIVINGTTLHSFMGIGLANGSVDYLVVKIQKNKPNLKKLMYLELLVLDEVSMLGDDLFEKINRIFQIIRACDKPFGGVQLVFVGDPFQLSPINSNYFFTSNVFNICNFQVVTLIKNMRTNELAFKELIDRLRSGECSDSDYLILKKLKKTEFSNNIKPTKLYSKRQDVESINNTELAKLIEAGFDSKEYPIKYINKHRKNEEMDYIKSFSLSDTITLCINAQVVVTKNIDILAGIVNGTRGIVTNMTDQFVTIKLLNSTETVIEYVCFQPDEFDRKFDFMYMPLKLGWALTIHSSQGMTLDAIELDLGENIFAYGQAYTGLSRVRNFNSVKIINLKKRSFKTSKDVVKFFEEKCSIIN
jgi:ATP-dependent DNA helicase PIF1